MGGALDRGQKWSVIVGESFLLEKHSHMLRGKMWKMNFTQENGDIGTEL